MKTTPNPRGISRKDRKRPDAEKTSILALLSPLSRLYAEAELPKSTSRSLTLMMAANLFGCMYGVICGSGTAAMIGLVNQIGADDFAFGILNGIPQAAAILQIPFAMLVNRAHIRKRVMMTFGVVSRALWMLFGLIPLLVPQDPASLRLWTLLFLVGVSSCCGASINVCWFPWFSDLAPSGIRGRWFSCRDALQSVCSIGFGLLTAYLLETLPPQIRYVLIFLLGGALGVMDMVCFGLCEERYTAAPKKIDLRRMLPETFRNRPFVRLTVMWTAWCFTSNLCGAYLGRYSMNEMGLSFASLMLYGTIAASVATVLATPFWGRALDRHRYRNVMGIACIGASLADAFYLFSAPGAIWPVLTRNFLGALFWSGANLSSDCMQLACSPDDSRPFYIAISACVIGLTGTALGTITGGALLEFAAETGLFQSADRYKALIALSIALRFSLTLLLVPRLEEGQRSSASA